MAPEWEMGLGMDYGMGMGMGMGMGASFSNSSAAVAPFSNATTMTSPAYLYGLPSTDTLRIDDLLDFSNNDILPSSAVAGDALLVPKTEPSSAATGSSSGFQPHHHVASFADDIYIPSEEAAELEWLSKFVDDSFSDIPSYPTTAMVTPPSTTADGGHLRGEPSAPGRGVRSKRSRATGGSAAAAAAAGWSTLAQTPAPGAPQSSPSSSSSSSSSDFPSAAKPNGSSRGKKGGAAPADVGLEGGVRRCTHCASEKTPQWRTGPLGPKTLCNACGVRFKSGRLVPEYRPAASPTFVLTQHSNSHRKVMELRRQKELLVLRPDHPSASSAAAGVPSELLFHDYGVC